MALTRQLVSVLPNNTLGNAASGDALNGSLVNNEEHLNISTNGRFIVFESLASNFSGSVTDNNNAGDIFLKDMQTGALTLISAKTDGSLLQTGAQNSTAPDVSDDGKYVVFQSLKQYDTYSAQTIYWKNTATGELLEVSTSYRTETAAHTVKGSNPSMSADGLKIVYDSNAETDKYPAGQIVDGQTQVFLRDMSDLQGKAIMLSQTATGTIGNAESSQAYISDDGNFAVFESVASNLFAKDTNSKRDILLKNLTSNEISVVSTSASGVLSNGKSENPMMSSNGRYVVFESSATNLIDGQTIGTGLYTQLYRKDLQTGDVKLISVNENGDINNGYTYKPIISADGRYVVFYDGIGSSLSHDANNLSDSYLYLKDMESNTLTKLDISYKVSMVDSTLLYPISQYAFSADGKYLILATKQGTMLNSPTGSDATLNLYRYDLSGITGGGGSGGGSVEVDSNYTLKDDETNLTLTGTKNINATGNDTANQIIGNTGKNTITGKGGDDTLDGGAGVDVLVGGAGNDTYTVDLAQKGTGAKASVSLQDKITEKGTSNDGTQDALILRGEADLSKASQITLSNFVEVLDASQTGNTSIYLMGNKSDNKITGNNNNNLIAGQDGADWLIGGAGNDTLIGGKGVDSLEGGAGDDNYYVSLLLNTDKTGVLLEDTMTETGGGIDTLSFFGTAKTTSNLTIDVNTFSGFENIDLSGTASTKFLNLTGSSANNYLVGNGASNTIIGNDGDDTLNGGGGADSLNGGAGNDAYVVDNAGDVITDDAGVADKVQSLLSNYTLASNIEQLEIIGKVAGKATGNALANLMTGNDKANKLDGAEGADTLNGGLGADTLTGGAGNDIFVFNTALKGNTDTIMDFDSAEDKLYLDKAIFTKLSSGLGSGNFVDAASSAGAKAQDADDYIIYDSSTGNLFYDADGSDRGAAIKFATFKTKPDLDINDFIFSLA